MTENHQGEGEGEEDKSFTKQFANSIKVNDNLSGIYLWLLFGFLSVTINCDLQRLVQNNPIILHLIGLYTFFFLFTSIDENNKAGLFVTWIKTFLIYILFVLTTKSKWYFAVIILLGLLIDKSYKYYQQQNEVHWDDDRKEKTERMQQTITQWITYIILACVFVGTVHYIYLQKIEYKSNFSYWKFFFHAGKCKKVAPTYKK